MKKFTTIIVVGFALFAMFFGAGNLIIPPFIGFQTGENWGWAFVGFFLTAIFAPFLGILVVTINGLSFSDLKQWIPQWLLNSLIFLTILCAGPLVAIPRTSATSFEIGVLPIFNDANAILFNIFFFGIVVALSISKSKVVLIIGRYLTPILLLSLMALIVLGIFSGNTQVLDNQLVTQKQAFSNGFIEGYQTLDVLASIIFAGIIISAVINNGYTAQKERISITILAGLVSTLSLLFIYGGLTFLGAKMGAELSQTTISRTDLLLLISHSVLGKFGAIIISVAIGFACLTTAIAMTSSTGAIFEKLSNGKIPYRLGVFCCTIVSFFLALNSVESIISYAIHILLFIYPMLFTVILLILFFGRKIKLKMPYVAGVFTTAVLSLISILEDLDVKIPFLIHLKNSIPLSNYELEWLLPSFVVFIVSASLSITYKTKRKEYF